MKNEKINKSSILVAVFYYNISNTTDKTNKNLKIHALVTKQKKEKSEKCLLVIQQWALEKNSRTSSF